MKMLKSKNIRRICVLLAMIAPAVYLFGSLFSALAGAHGQEVFAEPVYTEQYVDVDTFVADGSDYRLTISDSGTAYSWVRSFYGGISRYEYVDYTFNGYESTYFRYYTIATSTTFNYLGYGPEWLCSFLEDGTFNVLTPLPWVFEFSSDLFTKYVTGYGNLEKSVLVPTSEVAENAGAYSDFIFKNFFAKDNFLVEIGKDALSENPHGFVPFASFWKFLDNNMLHMGDMQLGLMGYGYVYYCCHVLLVDIAFILVTFFLDFIQRVNDKIVGGVD